ncbi:MAG TPA: PorT family protein [Bacteroidetes bacterium]|nr:PorT family protein [Bacteroidota bacterium]
MKKCVVFLLLIAAIPAANAQLFKIAGQEVGFVYVGPKVGLNFSKFNNWSYDYFNVKNKTGFQFGVVGEFGFTNKFSVQSEVVIISRGAKGEFNGNEETKKMPSIAIPVLARYTFSLLGLKKVYVNGGMYSTMRIGSGEITYDGGFTEEDYHWTRFDWGLSFGAGVEYPTDNGIWGVDLRYNLGLVDVYRQMDENTKSQFRTFGISVTYKYDFVDLMLRIRKKKLDPDAE